MQIVQEIRAKKVVPNGMALHDYVNLYFCARNPMLFKIRSSHPSLCVLRVNSSVLDIEGVVISDQNASSIYARFDPPSKGLAGIDKDSVFAEWWTSDDQVAHWQRKSAKCAEVLVPHRVDPGLVTGAYVSCDDSLRRFAKLGLDLAVEVNNHLFFL